MKKRNKLLFCCLGLLLGALLIQPMSIASVGVDGDPPDGGKILRGYASGSYKKKVGYHIEKYGFLGGEFSKVVIDYETFRCCNPTGNQMDGCSAPEICPNKR